MIRTHILPCRLPRADADALNRESGRIYTDVLVWHYRIYRRTRRWLSPKADERLNDSFGPTTLHAHSRDAAQQTQRAALPLRVVWVCRPPRCRGGHQSGE